MTKRTRAHRTERILIARLEELASAVERTGATHESVTRLLESASVATAHAIALELITPEQAGEIWQEAAERHPKVGPLRQSTLRHAA